MQSGRDAQPRPERRRDRVRLAGIVLVLENRRQVEVGVPQGNVDLVVALPALVVLQPQRRAAAADPDATRPQERDVQPQLAGDVRGGDRQVRLDAAQGDVRHRAQHQVVGQLEVPADTAGGRDAGPLQGQPASRSPVGQQKDGIVAIPAEEAFQIERESVADRESPRPAGLP